jgi:hypothetical protein
LAEQSSLLRLLHQPAADWLVPLAFSSACAGKLPSHCMPNWLRGAEFGAKKRSTLTPVSRAMISTTPLSLSSVSRPSWPMSVILRS